MGKIVVSIVSPLMGRRRCGVLWGFGGAVALAGRRRIINDIWSAGVPLLVMLLCCSTFCIDGSFSNLAPYTVERYGVRMGARSSGLGQAANGVGKILGPLSLALIAGTSNIVSPQRDRRWRCFRRSCSWRFAWCWSGCRFCILGVETHGKALLVGAQEGAAAAAAVIGGENRRR